MSHINLFSRKQGNKEKKHIRIEKGAKTEKKINLAIWHHNAELEMQQEDKKYPHRYMCANTAEPINVFNVSSQC